MDIYPGGLLQHILVSEHILKELVKPLVDDKILEEILVNNDGKTELRYVLLKPDSDSDLQSDFIQFVFDCVTMLHDKVLSRMLLFLEIFRKTDTRRKRLV